MSDLQSFAHSFRFAPLLLEQAAKQQNLIYRMSQAIAFLVSIGIMTIMAAKPFNPILGQTYQAWIGGFPLYIQQVSHHPPIMGIYFIGRGYKIYGSYQNKLTFTMDGAIGQIESNSRIHFDDGVIIEYTFPKVYVNGVILKAQQLNYEGKVKAIDRVNNLYTQLNFGPRVRSFFGNTSEPDDYVYGSLYEVKKQFVDSFT